MASKESFDRELSSWLECPLQLTIDDSSLARIYYAAIYHSAQTGPYESDKDEECYGYAEHIFRTLYSDDTFQTEDGRDDTIGHVLMLLGYNSHLDENAVLAAYQAATREHDITTA